MSDREIAEHESHLKERRMRFAELLAIAFPGPQGTQLAILRAELNERSSKTPSPNFSLKRKARAPLAALELMQFIEQSMPTIAQFKEQTEPSLATDFVLIEIETDLTNTRDWTRDDWSFPRKAREATVEIGSA